MTIASLVVNLDANIGEFTRKMDTVGRRVERTGRIIMRAGRELSQAISLPLLAAGFAAFHTLLDESHRHFGPLFQAFESLKAAVHDLFLAIGRELEPVFLRVIAALRGGIATLRGWIDAFHQLPAGIRSAVIYALAFLAAIGPTLLVIGKVVTAVGAMGKAFNLLLSPTGLVVAAILALAVAGIYVATHWDQVKAVLLEDLAAIVQAFFLAARATVYGIDIMTLGITELIGVSDLLRGKLNALEDRTLGKLGGMIAESNEKLRAMTDHMKNVASGSLAVRKAFQDLDEAQRRTVLDSQILGVTFNRDAADAQNLGTAIAALMATGISADELLNKMGDTLRGLAQRQQAAAERGRAFADAISAFGPTLDDQTRAAQAFWQTVASMGKFAIENLVKASKAVQRLGAQMKEVAAAIRSSLGDALAGLGELLGNVLTGGSNEFKQRMREIGAEQADLRQQLADGEISIKEYGKKMSQLADESSQLKKANQPLRQFASLVLGTIGAMMKSVGQALIAFGLAGIAIKKFIKSPGAAIAAGAALIILGSALSSAAGAGVEAGGNALAGGGGGSYDSSGAGGGTSGNQGPTTLVLRLESPNGLVDTVFRDPRNQIALARLIEELSGSQVLRIEQNTWNSNS